VSSGVRDSGAATVPRRFPPDQEHPWVAVDVVLYTLADETLQTLLVRIKHGPFAGAWAFPGGLVPVGESLQDAALRELVEKTPVRDVYLEQLFTFGDPSRNPTAHVVSTAYFALVPGPVRRPHEGTKYAEAMWSPVDSLPPLAYDHNIVATVALQRLRSKLAYTNVVYGLLAREFTLGELQRVYEVIRARPIDRRNFRKKILASGMLKRLNRRRLGPHRPATLYAFRDRVPKQIDLF
jgi:8-oxo-dGTP diphosphatase